MASHEDDLAVFKKRCSDITNNTFTGLSVAVGQKLRLFTSLSSHATADKPLTSQQFADAVDMRERYIREWLNGMVVARLVECTADGTAYWVSAAGGEVLTSPMTFGWMAAVPMMAMLFDNIVDCFKKDGTRYEQYTGFHEWMADISSGAMSEAFVVGRILPAVDGLCKEGGRGLDIGCGRGKHSLWFAQMYEGSQFVGIDFSAEAIDWAKANNLAPNVDYHCCDAKSLPADWTATYDVVTMFDALHDQGRPDLVLDEIHRVLKPGGKLVVVDIAGHSNVVDNMTDSKAPICYVVSLFHCMPVSMNEPNGVGLGTMWGREKAFEMFAGHGFEGSKIVYEDAMNICYVSYKREPASNL